MENVDFLFPVSIALDLAALAAVVLAPILGLVSLARHGWQQARFTIAYLGYACCAVLVASFATHFLLDGGDMRIGISNHLPSPVDSWNGRQGEPVSTPPASRSGERVGGRSRARGEVKTAAGVTLLGPPAEPRPKARFRCDN